MIMKLRFEEQYSLTRQIHRSDTASYWECIKLGSGNRFCVKMSTHELSGRSSPTSLEAVWQELSAEDMSVASDEKTVTPIIQLQVVENRRSEDEFLLLHELPAHPNITRLIDVLEDGNRTFLVMELLAGGSLQAQLEHHKEHHKEGFNEEATKRLVVSILRGLLHLHRNGICHNKLQPSNVLLEHSLDDGIAKLSDFTCATRMRDEAAVSGNTAYRAPEILHGQPSSAEADMWSVGVIIYACLFGRIPFSSRGGSTSATKLSRAEYKFPSQESNLVSRQAKQFIAGLLHVDPCVRMTAEEALTHPWLRAADEELAFEKPLIEKQSSLSKVLPRGDDKVEKPEPLKQRTCPSERPHVQRHNSCSVLRPKRRSLFQRKLQAQASEGSPSTSSLSGSSHHMRSSYHGSYDYLESPGSD